MRKFAVFILLLACGSAIAQTPSVNKLRLTVTATKERLSKSKQETASREEAKETWAYSVMVKNGAFEDLDNLKLEYRVFMKDEFHGPKDAQPQIKRKSGTLDIGKLPKFGEYPFFTAEFEVEKSELKANWVYSDGSKGKIKDSLYGIWLRIYRKDELVYEMMNPSTLKSEKW
jgi:hypothetical protein